MGRVFFAAVVALIVLSGCGGVQHISVREFKSQYQSGACQSMKCASYLGQGDGRAYLTISEMSSYNQRKWTTRTVYVRLDELDAAFRDSLPKTTYTAKGN